MLEKPVLVAEFLAYAFSFLHRGLRRVASRILTKLYLRLTGNAGPVPRDRNIVVLGANFAGYDAASIIATNLPSNSRYRVVVVEPNSHYQFTWVLPRFCVVKGHEHKAYIPYGGYITNAPKDAVRWIRDRAVAVTARTVELQDSDEEIPYDYLVVATGSEVAEGLPSRSNATDKLESMKRLRAMQQGIERASKIVVVGGGAAGVEVATDAKSLYPEKQVVLVHSRATVMHRFGKSLQNAAMEGFERLGVEAILEERVVKEDSAAGTVTLRSGRVIDCDFFINCTGQKPASGILKELVPDAISESGHVRIKPTLQLANDAYPNIYACGDVADTKVPNPNGRSAVRQAEVVAENVLDAVRGRKPSRTYKNHWADGVIKLTLGLDRSVSHMGDGKKEVFWESKETDEALMAARCWSRLGYKPFEDDSIQVDKMGEETSSGNPSQR